jgi:type IV secretory pathway VirB10-like protein
MNTFGVERRWIPTPTGKPRARIGLRVPIILVLCAGVVFACFFAIGRATHAGKKTVGESAPSPPVVSVSAAVPAQLASAPAIELTLVPPPPPPPPPAKSQAPAPAPATPRRSLEAPPASVSPTTPAPAPVRESAPAPVRESAPARTPAPSRSSGGGHPSPAPSGTFESSG